MCEYGDPMDDAMGDRGQPEGSDHLQQNSSLCFVMHAAHASIQLWCRRVRGGLE